MAAPSPPTGYALGVTEANPALLEPGPAPAPFARFRDALRALHPRYVRVLVDWARLQPVAGRPPDFTTPSDGCMRAVGPCLPFGGLAATLRAVKAMGVVPVVSIFGTPDWAARPVDGCRRPGTTAFAQMPDLEAYGAFAGSVLALGRSLGVALPLWSAWNEPNSPAFLSPQRASCAADAPVVAAGLYAQLAGALQAQLDAAPGDQRQLLGEVAGIATPHAYATSAGEFARALPAGVVCGAAGWAQHAYLVRPRERGARLEAVAPARTAGVVGAVEQALDADDCGASPPLWITETGVGDLPGGCAVMGDQLAAWQADPRIHAVFQYAFREDPVYPTGLADAGLTRLFPAYRAWASRSSAGCPPGA